MELFDKVYGCYFQVISHILEEASRQPLTRTRMEAIIQQYGFTESALTILPRLTDGEWMMLLSSVQAKNAGSQAGTKPTQYSAACAPVKLPLTLLQRSWLKALLNDERICLFLTEEELAEANRQLSDVAPLYASSDFHYFDRCLDGDPYGDPQYRAVFHTILKAFQQKKALYVAYRGKQEDTVTHLVAPYQLQFSPKDNKFRLCCMKKRRNRFSLNTVLNLNRIAACHLSDEQIPDFAAKLRFHSICRCAEPVRIEISGERNSLERCMLHFANYEKHTEYDEEKGVYLCSIYYDTADETELLIQILSFGPVIRVLGPEPFLAQVRERVRRQHTLLYGMLEALPKPENL